jgi:hypothetical protein
VASTKCVGAGSSDMGAAYHGEGPVLGSMQGLGRTSRYRNEGPADRAGRRWSGVMNLDIVCFGRAEQYAYVAAP